jgi:hypothetical protein
LEEAELGATAFKIFSFQQYSLQLNTNPQDCIAKKAQVPGSSDLEFSSTSLFD